MPNWRYKSKKELEETASVASLIFNFKRYKNKTQSETFGCY